MTRVALIVLVVLAPCAGAARQPQWPLKAARTLHTDAEIAQARANIAKYPGAKALAEKITKVADKWLTWSDQDLAELITDSRVPRAFDVAAAGCPVCGHKAYEKFGTYPWIVDPKIPFKIKCPVDGTVFPTNDYAAYYKSGLKDKKDWDSKYVDDGWGWKGPNGEKYWFVAYYNHWLWYNHLVPGLRALGQAYLLTGDNRYAHKAAVMLHRIAEVYPGMDHAKQSRYGTMMAARGIVYPGKVVNAIWETGFARDVAESYDAVWETIESEKDRAFIEANFLEDAVDAYFQRKIRGNFGMHQATLVTLGLVRQFGPQKQWFDDLLERADSDWQAMGLNYAMYDLMYRDGFPDETAPGYNAIWGEKFFELGELFRRTGRNLFAQPRLRRMCDAIIDQCVIGKHTPCEGDSGGFRGWVSGQNTTMFQVAYNQYRDPRFAQWLGQFKTVGEKGFTTFQSLFYPVVEDHGKLPPQPTRLLDGYGMGILNNAADTNAIAMYYGYRGGHGHSDRLNIDPFAEGVPIMPDMGYPDAMNDFVSGIYTWSRNTVAHNTVTVDAQRQVGNAPGTVQMFVDCPFGRAIDVEAKESYAQCSSYRRNVIMVDADAKHSYFLDVFTVAGGHQHDYSLHGPPGKFEVIGGQWSEPAAGTLAGTNVPLGKIYDNPAMEAPGYQGGFAYYAGSGFQHLFNVQSLKDGAWIGQWEYEKKPARLRLRVLEQSGQEVFLCDAHASPANHPELIKYVIARRQGDHLSSRFVSVIEPYSGEPLIREVLYLPVDAPNAVAVAVSMVDGRREILIYDPDGSEKKVEGEDLRTDAREVVLTLDDSGKLLRMFHAGGTYLSYKGERFDSPPAGRGRVTGVDREKCQIRVHLDSDVNAQSLVGRVVHFVNDIRRTAHPLIAARMEGDELVLTTRDDLTVGRALIDSVAADSLTTKTGLPIAPVYRGVTATTADARISCLVREVADGKVMFGQVLTTDQPFTKGEDVWLINVGTADRLEVPSIYFKEGK